MGVNFPLIISGMLFANIFEKVLVSSSVFVSSQWHPRSLFSKFQNL